MNNVLLSIIVPVYNAAPYLPACIESILNQTYKDIELILIDDGSKDNSGEICDDYALRDNRIKVVHKKNGGVSSARNAGLELATGEYVGWVDADDYIEPDMFEYLYKLAINYKADIAECGYASVDGNKVTVANFGKGLEFGEGRFITQKYLDADIFYGIVTKLYKRSLFEGVRFPEGRIWEDIWLVTYFCLETVRYVRNPEVKYYYRQTEGSIIRSDATPRKAREAIFILENSFSLIEAKIQDAALKNRLIKRNMEKAVFHYLNLALSPAAEIRKIYAPLYIRRMSYSVFECLISKQIPLKNKISYALCRMGLNQLVILAKKMI